jgi:small subunit ribosomal protein S5
MIRQKEIDHSVIQVKRVAKKNAGGTKISFSALVVVGDRKSKVGYGLGKAPTLPAAIQKAINKAKDSMFDVNLANDTIPHQLTVKQGASKIFAKPAPKGAGIIAGGAVRKVLELAGVKDVSAKIIGSNNVAANVQTTMVLLKSLKTNHVK